MTEKVVGREKPELGLIFEGTCFGARSLARVALGRVRGKESRYLLYQVQGNQQIIVR